MDGADQSLIYKYAKNHFQVERSRLRHCGFDTSLFVCTIVEILLLIALSNLLHMFLKRLGQPSTVSQMLAGFILGPTVLGHFNLFSKDNSQLDSIASSVRIFFMFLVGLEIDISYLRYMIRPAAVIVAGSAVACILISIIFGPFLFIMVHNLEDTSLWWVFTVTVFLVFFNTASPILIRVVNELKLTMTDIGRLAVSAALVTDVVCLMMIGLLGAYNVEQNSAKNLALSMLLMVMFVGGTTTVLRVGVNWVNKRNAHLSAVGDDVVFYLLMVVFTISVIMDSTVYDPMIGAFVFGLFIPRDGPTARTIIERLTYLVHNLLLPVYFGAAALQVDIGMLRYQNVLVATLALTVLGIVGKIGGTIAAAKYLGMKTGDSWVLAILLNIRGHVNLLVISLGNEIGIWEDRTYMALIISLFINSIIACPAITYIARQNRQTSLYMYCGLEWLDVVNELRILTCIHSPNDIPTILNLIEISSGINKRTLTPHILHLMELIGHATSNVLYHQLGDRDHDNIGGNQAQQVNVAVDMFIKETNIHLYQLTAISRITSMHEDVQNAVQDTHSSLVIVPFHRKLKLDGKMGVGKQDIRHFNMNVLARTPCSVGILVDRGMRREERGSISSEESTQINVLILFIGGPDDREAAAYGGRLALHSSVNVTLLRFKPKSVKESGVYLRGTSVSSTSSTVLMDVEREDADEDFMAKFYNRFMVTGLITFEEKEIENSAELIVELQSMTRIYSLYIVGRKVQGPSAKLTEGMGDWEECPELGSVGDLLASSDFSLDGSVLVIQQYNESYCYVYVNSS